MQRGLDERDHDVAVTSLYACAVLESRGRCYSDFPGVSSEKVLDVIDCSRFG